MKFFYLSYLGSLISTYRDALCILADSHSYYTEVALQTESNTRAARLRKELMNLNIFLVIFQEQFYPHMKALHISFQMRYDSLLSSWN